MSSSRDNPQPPDAGGPGEGRSGIGFMAQAIQQWMDENVDWEGGGPDDTDYVPPAESAEESDEHEDDIEDDEQQSESESEDADQMQGVDSVALTETDMDLPSMNEDSFDDPEDLEPLSILTRLRLVTRRGVVLHNYHSDDEESGDSTTLPPWARSRKHRRRRPSDKLYPPIPNEAGKKLMKGGLFGQDPTHDDVRRRTDKSLTLRLMYRELNPQPRGLTTGSAMTQDLIPGTYADKILHHETPCYSGQFSADGNFFFCCSQDFKVRLYDTGNPIEWKHYKTVTYPFGQWTLTDASLSPDNRHLAFSSICNVVCVAETNPKSNAEPVHLDFSRDDDHPHGSYFGIWSIKFSPDGREILAGTRDRSVIAYDLETKKRVVNLRSHKDDVNAVCWGESNSPHIIYSGSDDSTVRVWDRRSMKDGRESGVFMGHTEGITYIDSKGDGRYAISNSKDQTMKLWDIRMMMDTNKFRTLKPMRFMTGYDYRWRRYPIEDFEPHPHDCSVVTFRGHKVLKTLIRCHFSPAIGSNSRYVYTGSADGKVYIYNIDATIARIIDVKEATYNTRPRDQLFGSRMSRISDRAEWKTCVRDASWHPSCPVIAATAWNAWDAEKGTCSIHSWGGELADKADGEPPYKSLDAECNEVEEFENHYRRVRQGGLANL